MNGHRLPCGCFDGHHVDGDEEPVALRCSRHPDVPARIPGAVVRRLDEASITRLAGTPSTFAGGGPSRVRGGTLTGIGSARARGRSR